MLAIQWYTLLFVHGLNVSKEALAAQLHRSRQSLAAAASDPQDPR